MLDASLSRTVQKEDQTAAELSDPSLRHTACVCESNWTLLLSSQSEEGAFLCINCCQQPNRSTRLPELVTPVSNAHKHTRTPQHGGPKGSTHTRMIVLPYPKILFVDPPPLSHICPLPCRSRSAPSPSHTHSWTNPHRGKFLRKWRDTWR